MNKETAKNIVNAIRIFYHSMFIGATEDEAALITQSLLIDDKESYNKLIDETLDAIKKRRLEQARTSLEEQFQNEVKSKVEHLKSIGCKGSITYQGKKYKL